MFKHKIENNIRPQNKNIHISVTPLNHNNFK